MKIGLLQCSQVFLLFFWPSDLIFDPAWPSFELSRGINGTNVLTKFHEDYTMNVASRVFTRQMLTMDDGQLKTHDGQKAITKAHHEHVALRWAQKLWPILKFSDGRTEAIYLTFNLEGLPWPSLFTTQYVQLHKMHMHANWSFVTDVTYTPT